MRCLAYAIFAVVLVAASPSSSIQPGEWAVTVDMTEAIINGQSQPGFAGRPQKSCLLPEDVAKGPGIAFSDPDLCSVQKSNLDNGKFEYTMLCKKTEGRGTIITTAKEKYDGTSYTGDTVSIQKDAGRFVEMHGHMTGKRVGDCG